MTITNDKYKVMLEEQDILPGLIDGNDSSKFTLKIFFCWVRKILTKLFHRVSGHVFIHSEKINFSVTDDMFQWP